jgi:LysM repeat protein
MSQRNRDKIKSLFVRPDGSSKLKKPETTFSVKAGKFGEGSNTLSGIAETLGVSLKSLETGNPQIKDLNKISAGQSINIPLRKQSFVERFILGDNNKPPTRRVKTEGGKEEELAVKKGAEGPVYRGMSKSDMAEIQMRQTGGVSIKEIPTDLMQQYRENFYDKGRDDTMSLTQYVQSGRAARDLKAGGKKRGGMKTGKKHIMDMPTNVPRLRAGATLGDLNKDGKMSGYEKVRQAAIQKNMDARKKK